MSITLDHIEAALAQLRTLRPLVHNITNHVVMDISANALLAVGASPAMVHALDEVEDFAGISQALVCNIGTLSPEWIAAMRLAAQRMNRDGKPWVLDPVGCGATPYRTRAAVELARLGPAIIRGNASEILSLAGSAGERPKGVDSAVGSEAALLSAKALADLTGAVVAVTGATDYVTDGKRIFKIKGGHALMPLITGMGCSLSAITGAFAAAVPDRMLAATAALVTFKVCGGRAGEGCAGPGSFRLGFMDALHGVTPADLRTHGQLANA